MSFIVFVETLNRLIMR